MEWLGSNLTNDDQLRDAKLKKSVCDKNNNKIGMCMVLAVSLENIIVRLATETLDFLKH